MITQEKLKIYDHFNGNIDGWARIGTKEQKLTMRDNDWFLIDGFIQDILLVKKGLASVVYIKNLEEKLREKCDSEETIEKLKEMSNK